VATLLGAGIELLVDVRAVANSRRPGYSKTRLSATLVEAGIEYLHLRSLGTPADGRAAARAGRHQAMRDIFTRHLQDPAAKDELAELARLVATGKRVCLLCLEANPAHCHRTLVAEAVGALVPTRVEHLSALPGTELEED
jgi:uncharacterized protein (DUF488 family)